ncbi:Cloroperoxidase [Gloeophyllum trabeum ATCC 11539]|uniref:Cloroperoxidase n=1 Tax=Gloeophyllum trabeum (strain ATCC 11539 / FP-39264 / Madison 617) TaxID=670483 RepID=S7QJJ6_GLOTA|nr:Cloroperoxidase [Gloeophyllum trabeum ATCC 11539]EPQ59866.1 Cloroperoxidase [Gloeophyllum trabeum ATCC 11539]
MVVLSRRSVLSILSPRESAQLKSVLTVALLAFLLALVAHTRDASHDSLTADTNNAFAGTHAYIPPSPSASRSPCPALNTLANHGYLPRDGKNIHPAQIITALRDGYGLSTPLAWVLTYGGYFLLRNPPMPTALPHLAPTTLAHFTHLAKSLPTVHKMLAPFDLRELALHNHIEHDASLVHANTAPQHAYAPTQVVPALLHQLFAFAAPQSNYTRFTLSSIAKARVLREYQTNDTIDAFHAEVARGEVALVLGIFGAASTDIGNLDEKAGGGIDVALLETWFGQERLPAGWAPRHVQTLTGTVQLSKAIRAQMQKIGRDAVTSAPAAGGEAEVCVPAPHAAPIVESVSLNSSASAAEFDDGFFGELDAQEMLLNASQAAREYDYDFVLDSKAAREDGFMFTAEPGSE